MGPGYAEHDRTWSPGSSLPEAAIEAASGARRAFRHGVWLAELGGLRDPALLVAKVVRSLGLPDQSGRWAMVTLVDHLRARQVLLVID